MERGSRGAWDTGWDLGGILATYILAQDARCGVNTPRGCSLGVSEPQLPTAAPKISVCLLFIPPSPAEPTQLQERSWSLFLALQSLPALGGGAGVPETSGGRRVPLPPAPGADPIPRVPPGLAGSSLPAEEGLGKEQERGCPGTALSIAAGFGLPGERLQCRRISEGSAASRSCFPRRAGRPGAPASIPWGQGQGRGQAGMQRVLGAGRARGRSPGSIATGTCRVMESFLPALFAWP